MQLGFGVLRHSSQDFWSLTPRELFCAAQVLSRQDREATSRDGLTALMAEFPDSLT
ncbi:MAG: phage tail assembly chaperone [Hyphomicrobiales bacterium]|nr:phage tail assembly chaperone [Hyphomicrobiales bacterium]